MSYQSFTKFFSRTYSLVLGQSNGYHYSDVIMNTMASQITSLTIVYSTVYSGANQRKHQSSASLAFVLGIHRWPVNSPHKGPVTRKLFPFDDVIMTPYGIIVLGNGHHQGNGLSFVRRQAITWTNTDFLSISPLGSIFGEIGIKPNNLHSWNRILNCCL